MEFEAPARLVRALGDATDAAPGDGAHWPARVPELVREATGLLGLSVERVQLPGGRSSVVVLVRRADGTPAALKLAPPQALPEREAKALVHWDGHGACRLLDSSVPGALLLERLQPDVTLRSLPEAKALLEAAGVVRRLWVEPPADHGFETVLQRTEGPAKAMATVDEQIRPLATSALEARAELLAHPAEQLLLHGEFHQGKALAGDRTHWLAVGPVPVVGERAYELARPALDRLDDLVASSSGASTARRRVNRLADSLDVDRDRLRGWTLFRAVDNALVARREGRRSRAELLLEFAAWL
ncbi:aminoglycoside phosphotransferase family protein [Streptomyces sp. YIM 130001]|uniref:aminoglycoside phosphotransferase family protein n=1 Tax=Streptomyces sp. YIM 130001 TaxID=2259644 RepID=UPI000E6526FD|nr:aminoglycoside phosphotransferase family protein [Streptomyces sp. YIM 130001]